MDPLTILLLAAITAYSVFVTVFFAYLTWLILVEWFQQNERVATQLDNVAAAVKTALEGEPAVVQGIFNKKTGDPVKGRIIKYEDLDAKTRAAFRQSDNDVLIFQ